MILILFFIYRINEFSHVNKMHIQNLGVIFKPAIFHDFKQLDEGVMVVCPDELFEDLIINHAALFHNAESHAQKMHDAKLKQALPGQKLYNQSSQSNLLYSVRKQTQGGSAQTPQSRNMLLTQPMNPPKVQESGNNNSGYYNAPPSTPNTYYPSQQQIPQQQQQQQNYQQQQKIPQQQYQQQIPQQQYQQQYQQQQLPQTQAQQQPQTSKYQIQQQQHNQYYGASENTNNAQYTQTQRKASLMHSQQTPVPSTPVYSNSAGMGSNSRLVPQGHRIDSIDKAHSVPNNTVTPQSYSSDALNVSQYSGSQNNSPMSHTIQDTNTIQSQKSGSSTSLASGNLNTRAYYNNNTGGNIQGNYQAENTDASPVQSASSLYYRPNNYKKATHLEISTRPQSPIPPKRGDSLGQDTPRSNSSLSSPIGNNETDFATYYASPNHSDIYAHHS